MRTKFKIWQLCLIVGLASVALATYIWIRDNDPNTLTFLRGKAPVVDGAYAIQTPFSDFRIDAERELLDKGFKIIDDAPDGFGRKWRSVTYARGSEFVNVFENMRYELPREPNSPHQIIGYDMENWVSVQVSQGF